MVSVTPALLSSHPSAVILGVVDGMLVDLSGPITINPFEYPTTLAVRLDTDNRSQCGVFAGKHTDFSDHEEGKLLPVIDDDDSGRKTFVLDRPERETREQIYRRWDYVAIGWINEIHIEFPDAYRLTLAEHDNGPENHFWAITVTTRFTLLLSDYEPGALARGVVRIHKYR
jgi:hypothetical protein